MINKIYSSIFNTSSRSITPILKATLLLFISIAGNFLAETLGCKTQLYLENMYVKHLLVLFMIYFTIDFTQGDNVSNPIINLKNAIIIWVLFHLFTHLDIVPTVSVLFLFMIIFFISNYLSYLEKIKSNDQKLKDILVTAEKTLLVSVLFIIVVGFFYYYIEKRTEYKNRFNILKFIFGVKKCKKT